MKAMALTVVGMAIGSAFTYAIFSMRLSPATNAVAETSAAEYNCELSAGEFSEGHCTCEKDYTGKEMYDPRTGFCQTEHGGPAGDAFAASTGLPYGMFGFWTPVIGRLCTESGGDWLTARCTCPEGKTYDQEVGKCITER